MSRARGSARRKSHTRKKSSSGSARWWRNTRPRGRSLQAAIDHLKSESRAAASALRADAAARILAPDQRTPTQTNPFFGSFVCADALCDGAWARQVCDTGPSVFTTRDELTTLCYETLGVENTVSRLHLYRVASRDADDAAAPRGARLAALDMHIAEKLRDLALWLRDSAKVAERESTLRVMRAIAEAEAPGEDFPWDQYQTGDDRRKRRIYDVSNAEAARDERRARHPASGEL